jgi:hypothetical protein
MLSSYPTGQAVSVTSPSEASGTMVCLRQPGLKKAKNVCSLSPPSGAPRRIAAVADEERS